MKINFDSIKVYTDLGKTQSVTQNMRKEFANCPRAEDLQRYA